MKIIVDAGGTKTDWILIDREGTRKVVTTAGINASHTSDDVFRQIVHSLELSTTDSEVEKIEYYGAGCATDAICQRVEEMLSSRFNKALISVGSDLLGAAKALFGDKDGIACILGTGSNSCMYVGGEIVSNIPPLGYILGDEGSGAALGKRLIADMLRGMLHDSLTDEFIRRFGVTKDLVIEKVYRGEAPAAWLASFVPFLAENIESAEVRTILIEEFSRFVLRNVALYPDSASYPLAFSGSVAYVFSDILKQVCQSLGYQVVNILKSPKDKLI